MDDAGSEFSWPLHGRPTPKCWTLWQEALRKCFLTLELSQVLLRRPLGKWIIPTDQPDWHWFYSPIQDRVYHRQDETSSFECYSVLVTQRRLRSPKYIPNGTSPDLPNDVERTTVSQQPTFVWCHGSQPSTYQPRLKTSVKDHVKDHDLWAIRSFDCPNNGATIAQAILQGTALAICDGSYKDQFGTAGFAIQNGSSRDSRILGANVTPGHPEDQNPYRSEVGGIAAIVIIVEALTTVYAIQNGSIELGCDCESALTAIFAHEYDTPSQPHHDLIHEIRRKLAASPITWTSRHVRGHQDKHVQFKHLDMWSQLNVEMDSLAKSYWNETQPTVQPFYPRNTFGWSLWISDRKMHSWDRTSLYNHAMSHEILAHWSTRHL